MTFIVFDKENKGIKVIDAQQDYTSFLKKIDELNGVIIDREKEISTLQSKVTDLTIQVDKKSRIQDTIISLRLFHSLSKFQVHIKTQDNIFRRQVI